MKTGIFSLPTLLLCAGMVMTVPSFAQTQTGSGSGTKTENIKDIPIIIKRSNPQKETLAPAKRLSMTLSITDGRVYFSLPLENYPLQVELEQTSPSGGYWTTTLFEPNDCLENFDGTSGSYHITITDPEASEYTGDFYL